MFKFKRSGADTPVHSFYCRHHNRVVGSCPMTQGPPSCPIRRNCPAYAGYAPAPVVADPTPPQS